VPKKYRVANLGDIWIKWNIKDDEGKLIDFKELMIAVSNEYYRCFVARNMKPNGWHENLLWSQDFCSEELITIQDREGFRMVFGLS